MPKSSIWLDHIVILVPYKDLADPPPWISANFLVSPGGRHADDRTENRLILFQDGTYIELIAFVHDDPARRKGHIWDGAFGMIDYALSTAQPLDHAGLRQRLEQSGTGIEYAEPKRGGRTTPAGVVLQWEVTLPLPAHRGEVLFWCHDVTPRERRVPVSASNTKHPCGALGVSAVLVAADENRSPRLRKAIDAITDGDGSVGTPLGSREAPSARIQVEADGQLKDGHQLRLQLVTNLAQLPEGIHEKFEGNGSLDISFRAPAA